MNPINKVIVQCVKLMPKPVVRFFSNRYIAGDKIEDGIATVRQLNSKGILATMDVLGESIRTREEAVAAFEKCMEVLESIQKEKLLSNLSIKPTQFGLELDEEFAYGQVRQLVVKAREYNNFVRLDMEDSSTTGKIIHLYKRLHSEFSNVGIVLQAYLRRTMADVRELNELGTNYRLCKGIYIEPASVAFKDKQEVRDNFLSVLREMFVSGRYVGVATHDETLVTGTKAMVKELGIGKNAFEFQMLLGVREDLRDALNNEGFKVRIYVPFGKDWYKYSIRRLQENPNIAGHIVKNFFSLN